MRAIITATGKDHAGIIAAVTQELARLNVNIVDLSQTLMSSFFTMIILVVLPDEVTISRLQEVMKEVETAQAVSIRVQSEATFDAMHRI